MRLYIQNETGMPIKVCHDPLLAVVLGAGQSLESFEALKNVLFSSQNHS